MTRLYERTVRRSLPQLVATALAALACALVGVLPARAQPAVLRPPAIHVDVSGSMTLVERGERVVVPLKGSGDVNLNAPFSSRMHVTAGDLLMGVFEMDVLIVNNTIYARIGLGRWIPMNLPFAMQRMLAADGATATEADGEALLRAAERAGVTLTRLPDETIRGIATRHEQMQATGWQLRDLLLNLPPTTMSLFGDALGPNDLADLPLDLRMSVEMWTGIEDGFVYRMMTKEETGTDVTAVTYDYTPLAERVPLVAPD